MKKYLFILFQGILLHSYAQKDTMTLKEVIVESRLHNNDKVLTIGKSDITAKDLPQAVTVIGRTVIESQQAQKISDVLRNVNGVYLGSTRGATQESFSARGYTVSSNNLFKDGVRINSGSFPETGSLERVEVLKGSAAILYGNVAPGGIINLVTKQPRFESGGEIGLRAGSYGLIKPWADLYGRLNSISAYRINGSYESQDSYRDKVQSKRVYVNPSLLFKTGNKTELLLQGDFLKHDFTPDFGIGTVDNTHIPAVARSAYFGTPWQYAKVTQTSATVSVKHIINERWKLNGSVSNQNYLRDYYSTERIQALANGDWSRPLNRSKNAENYYTAQIYLSGEFNSGFLQHSILTGIDVERYDATVYGYDQPLIYDTINLFDANKYRIRTDIPASNEIKITKTPTNRLGGYVQDLLAISSKWKMLLGVRWSFQESKSGDIIKTDKAFSPRAGIVYQPRKNTSLFISYANSFSVNSGTDVYGNALAPSIIDQYELGIKNTLFQNSITCNLTIYKIINHNLAQTALFAADGVTPNNNTSLKALTGETASDGIEIDLMANPFKGLDILAGYSYNYIRYTKTPDAKGNFIEGERLQNSIGSTANASFFYSINGWKFGGGFYYTGPRTAGFNNTKGQTQNYNRLFGVSDFSTIDLSAGYGFSKTSILVKLSNLTNTLNYITHENYSINPIAPRQIMLSVSHRL